MPFCSMCGKELTEGGSFCPSCGRKLSDLQSGPKSVPSSQITDEDLTTFIGKNADKYLRKFREFSAKGVDSYKATWHWPAFFVPFFWMLYRKLYLWSLLAFFLGLIPYVGFLAMIIFGITGNYIYYKHTRNKLLELQRSHPPSEVQRAVDIARAGGVNNVAIVVAPLLCIAILGILAAIAIPQFAAYRQKAFNAQARTDLQLACGQAQSILSDAPETNITIADIEAKGFKSSPDVQVVINDGTKQSFNMTATHTKGTMMYEADGNCNISEEVRAR